MPAIDDAYRYRDQFAALIGHGVRDWKRRRLPFLWVQLANFRAGVGHAASR